MKIVADENIPYAREAFGTLGEVQTAAGRSLTADMVRDADVLIVRSVTLVNEELLRGSRVRFVATCTIGTDHVDVEYLHRRGIPFASAPGTNANSVAEYLSAALLVLAREGNFELKGKTVGVIGIGNVGSRVVRKAQALGMRVLMNDPPLAEKTGDSRFLPLDALFDAEFLTLHVPLTTDGPYPTYHMVLESFLERTRPGAVLINTSRGSVVETDALIQAIKAGRTTAVLDVWEDEPGISIELLNRAAIGTPHIAGYSFDGKVAATEMVYHETCRFLGVEPCWKADSLLPPAPIEELEIHGQQDHEDIIREAVLTVYDIEEDDAQLRKIVAAPKDQRPPYFDSLRKAYPVRREFRYTTVTLRNGSAESAVCLEKLGFRVKDA